MQQCESLFSLFCTKFGSICNGVAEEDWDGGKSVSSGSKVLKGIAQ